MDVLLFRLLENTMKEREVIAWGWAGTQYVKHCWVRYSLTHEGYKKLWAQQDGKCAGCKEPLAHPFVKSLQKGLKPEVDHKHTEKLRCEAADVRGLLCRRCNDFLEKIQDNADTLQNLVDYLKRHGDWK